MSILDEILSNKKQEVEKKRELYPVKLLEQSIYFDSPCVSLKKYVKRPDKVGVIAEIKRKSPARNDLNPYIQVDQVANGYMHAGASAVSVLTDEKYFGGKNEDLTKVRQMIYGPVLRKDFIIDEYQIVEARSIGADAILLIAAALYPEVIRRLAAFAHSLGLEVLLEVHDANELDRSVNEHVDIIGINNRNLKDGSISLDTSLSLFSKIPSGLATVSESGITSPEDAFMLRKAGFDGFLIGAHFMKTPNPPKTCLRFIQQFRKLLEAEKQNA
ncbi:MAG: indole-3-glycerol phosphate synthase TrpC [Bacteroidia bacterium]|nr:indole-3-glycerol phosphate synthase TrpC [Bacteroidia bacterium]